MRLIAAAILLGFAIEIWIGTRKLSDEAEFGATFAYMVIIGCGLLALTVALAILGLLTRNRVVLGFTLMALAAFTWTFTGGTGIFSTSFRLGIAALVGALPATFLPHSRRRPVPAPGD